MRALLSGTAHRTVVLIVFLGACGLALAWLVSGTGTKRPGVDSGEYTASVVVKDVDNLVHASLVQVAGVRVGRVREVEQVDGGARITIALSDDVAPLHRGVNLRIGERSLVGETYVDVTDGRGAALPSGVELPAAVVQPSVQVRDVLADLDPASRDALGKMLRSLGEGTRGTQADVQQLLVGLGKLGRDGHTALDAIAAQSEDLTRLARSTRAVLEGLDTGQGQIATMVSNANDITAATAGQAKAIEATLRQAPGVLDRARQATGSLSTLAGSLRPVAADLRAAAPHLSTALRTLPATTRDLDAMLKPLFGVLEQAPPTLRRVPGFSRDLSALTPEAGDMLAEANPMLKYISPYGPELAAYLANFNAVLNYKDENGASYLRLTPLVNSHSPQLPFRTDRLLGNYTNPYPAPGSGSRPGPFVGPYPRIERGDR